MLTQENIDTRAASLRKNIQNKALLARRIKFRFDPKKDKLQKTKFFSHNEMGFRSKTSFWEYDVLGQERNTHIKRFAFYQAGKCLVQTLLLDHPKVSLLKITESKNTTVSSTQGVSPIQTRVNLETLLIGFCAGEAGELFTGYSKMQSNQGSFSVKNKNIATILRPRKHLVRVNGLLGNGVAFQAKINFEIKTRLSQITYTCGTFYDICTKDCFFYKPWFSERGHFEYNDFVLQPSSNIVKGTRSEAITGTECKTNKLQKTSFFARQSFAFSKLRFGTADAKASHFQNFVLERQSKQKVGMEVKNVQNNTNLLPLRTKFFDSSRERFQRDIIERCGRSESLVSSKCNLLIERDKAVLMSFNNFALSNQLSCTKIEQFLCKSTLGFLERINSTFLAQSMLVDCSIYSKNLFNLQKNSIVGNLNKAEIKDQKVFDLFQNLEEQIKNTYLQKYKQIKVADNLLFSKKLNCISQHKEVNAWCEELVCKSLTFSRVPYGHWFRIYLPQIETHQRQSVSSDQFFKKRRELGFVDYTKINFKKADIKKQINLTKNLQNLVVLNKSNVNTTSIPFSCASPKISFLKINKKLMLLRRRPLPPQNEVVAKNGRCRSKTKFWKCEALAKRCKYEIFAQTLIPIWPQELGYDMCHNLVLNASSRTFNLIGKNRELLDILADHLIRFEKIRVPEISRICSFYLNTKNALTTFIE